MTRIDSIEQWNAFAADLRELGALLWQMQYDTQHPDGFHARFSIPGNSDVEAVTYNQDVQDAMVGYKP